MMTERGIFPFGTVSTAIVLYIYFALCLVSIARKAGHADRAWWGWIPIVQIFLILRVANVPLWWFLLLFIPIVNIVIGVLLWIKVAKGLGKSPWWGVAMIIPVVNLFALGYLAFSR